MGTGIFWKNPSPIQKMWYDKMDVISGGKNVEYLGITITRECAEDYHYIADVWL